MPIFLTIYNEIFSQFSWPLFAFPLRKVLVTVLQRLSNQTFTKVKKSNEPRKYIITNFNKLCDEFCWYQVIIYVLV